MTLRIHQWDKHFEKAGSRKLVRMEWIAIPNKTDGEGYTALVDHPNGAAHLGAWLAILQVASKQEDRGSLPKGIPASLPGICASLARMSRLPVEVFLEALPRLIEIGWIEDQESAIDLPSSPIVSHDPPPISQDLPRSATVVADGGRLVSAHNTNKTEQNNTKTEQNITHTEQTMTMTRAREIIPQWKRDEQFARFATDYLSTGAALIDADFAAAYDSWQRLNLGQRLERVAALNRHLGEYSSDPRFVPKPLKFLDTEWERPLRPPGRATRSSEDQQRRDEAIEGMRLLERIRRS